MMVLYNVRQRKIMLYKLTYNSTYWFNLLIQTKASATVLGGYKKNSQKIYMRLL